MQNLIKPSSNKTNKMQNQRTQKTNKRQSKESKWQKQTYTGTQEKTQTQPRSVKSLTEELTNRVICPCCQKGFNSFSKYPEVLDPSNMQWKMIENFLAIVEN